MNRRMNRRPSLLEIAGAVAAASRAHMATGCAVCRPHASLTQLCPEGRAAAIAAAHAPAGHVADRSLCRCYDPTAHAPDCSSAVAYWAGRTCPTAVWYQDREGDWWRPTHVDVRGCLVLLLDGDPANVAAVPLDDAERGFGPFTATSYGAYLNRAELPSRPQAPSQHVEQRGDFFRAGHTYEATTRDGDAWAFRADAITTSPRDGQRTALGWRHFRGTWEPYEYPEHAWKLLTDGPTPITERA